MIKENSKLISSIFIDVIAQNGDKKRYVVNLVSNNSQVTTTTINAGSSTTLSDNSSDITTTTFQSSSSTTTLGSGSSTTTVSGGSTTTVGVGSSTTLNNGSTTTVTNPPVTTTSSTTTTTTIPYDGVIIYYKSSTSDPTIWAWELNGEACMTKINNTYAWPGPKMTAVIGKTNWYKFEIPSSAMSTPIKELHMKFKGEVTEYTRSVPVKTGWLSGSTWTDECPDLPSKPSITISPKGGTVKGTDKVTISLTSELEITSRTVSFGGTSVSMNSNSLEITVSSYVTDGQTKTLTVSATNSSGTKTESADFSRNDSYVPPENPFSWDNALVYFVMTDRFYNSNPANDLSYGRVKTDSKGKNIGTFHGGDLAGLKQKVDANYYSDLGVNAIWKTAPYEQIHGGVGGGSSGDFAHYAYHGYYALDFTALDKNMGTIQELREFVDAAHDKNIRVVFDIVMNHAGYENLKDMETYNFGSLKSGSYSWQPSGGETFHQWNDLKGTTGWENWWTASWARTSFYGNGGGDDLTKCLDFLPDFKTEVTSGVGVPKVLETKWGQETTGFTDWINPSAVSLRTNLNVAPAEYLIKWLAAWVKEFGIDGFRVDTAKHVDMYRWAALKMLVALRPMERQSTKATVRYHFLLAKLRVVLDDR